MNGGVWIRQGIVNDVQGGSVTTMTTRDKGISRRTWLSGVTAMAGCFVLDAGGVARAVPAGSFEQAPSRYRFPQGVASGDPQPDKVVLWTRVEDTLTPGMPVSLRLQLSQDPSFATVLADQAVTVTAESDFCARIVMRGLTPKSRYYYRFLAGSDISPKGRTVTAPEPGDAQPFNFAFASCQNFEQGFYGAWRRMILEDEAAAPDKQLSFVLFLGDFIYEVRGDRWNADMRNPTWLKGAAGHDRAIPPFPDGSPAWPSTDWNINPGATNAVTLADYRFLYKLYLSDPHLQAARARWPFVHTWDDHEFTNDGWQSHDTYFDQGGTPAQARKLVANQAWFEFIPSLLTEAFADPEAPNPARDFALATVATSSFTQISEESADFINPNTDNIAALASMTIYRSLKWGALGELFLTDNRSYKSPPLEIPRDHLGNRPPLPPMADIKIMDAGRTANGGKPPRILPVSRAPNPRHAAPSGSVMGGKQRDWFKTSLKASKAAWKFWANSFPALPLRLDVSNIPMSGLPDGCLGLDGWNGYPGERNELMAFIMDQRIANVVSLAGDHHIHMAGILVDDPDAPEPKAVAHEFAVAGMSSEPQFPGVVRATGSNAVFNAVATFQSGGQTMENWNLALTKGTRAALIRAFTGSQTLSEAYANPSINPGLLFTDTNANGYARVGVSAEALAVDLVTVASAEMDYGDQGAPILRKTVFTVPLRDVNAPAALTSIRSEGTPAFPQDLPK